MGKKERVFGRSMIPWCLAALALGACGGPPPEEGASAEGAASPESASLITPDWCQNLPRPGNAELERVPVADSWFEVYRVAPDVLAIYEPHQWQEVLSYLILGADRALLFDSGMGIGNIRSVVDELTSLPVSVLASHSHYDHFGGHADFERILAMDTEFTRSQSRGVGHEVVGQELAPEALCRALPEGFEAETYSIAPFEIDEFIGDGHEIDLGNRRLRVVSIPGHTPDSIALYDAEVGFLWTGDSFYEGPIYLMDPETDLEAYGKSVERLAALAPELTRVFPGHNTAVAEPIRLQELGEAFAAVQAGTAEGTRRADYIEYAFDAFSFLVLPDP